MNDSLSFFKYVNNIADLETNGYKYIIGTNIPVSEIYTAYHNLWHVERAFPSTYRPKSFCDF